MWMIESMAVQRGDSHSFSTSLTSAEDFAEQVWDLMEGDYTVISDIPSWAGVDAAALPPQAPGFNLWCLGEVPGSIWGGPGCPHHLGV